MKGLVVRCWGGKYAGARIHAGGLGFFQLYVHRSVTCLFRIRDLVRKYCSMKSEPKKRFPSPKELGIVGRNSKAE